MPVMTTAPPFTDAYTRAAEPPVDATLDDLLREVLAERSGDTLMGTLGGLHAAAARRGEHGADEELAALVADLDADSALPLARACTMHLAMANLADELRRLQERRDGDRNGGEPPPMSLAEAAELVERDRKSVV
jgi:phosphoenolpyruvate carboxylase